MQKSKLKIWGICIVGLILLVFAGFMLIKQIRDYRISASIYDDTEKKYVLSISEESIEEAIKEKSTSWKDLIDVDISELRKDNEDIVGWIYFENEDISYPVLYSGDNSTYLRKTYTGEAASAGSIFVEATNSKDFSDAHTIIYGHNMKDLSMFGPLRYYVTKQDYINEHEYFQIITEKEKYRYKIISCKEVTSDSEVYTVYSKGNQDFLNFVNNVLTYGNYLPTEGNITFNDHLITLSTCLNDGRLVITAVRCDEGRRV